MCKIKDNLLEKIYKQIEEKKKYLGKPTIHNFEDGVSFLNYFDTWNDSIVDGAKMLPIINMGDVPKDKNIQFVYSEMGTHVPLHDFAAKKTYVVLRGKIRFFFKEGDDLLLEDYSSTVIPKGVLHGGDTIEDSFVLVIEDQCVLPKS